MKRLTDVSNLVMLGFAVALFPAMTPLHTASAGEYIEDEYDYAEYDDEVYNSGANWYEYGYASAYSSSLGASCSASAEASAWIEGGNGGASGSVTVSSSSYAIRWWEWTGGGTPTGGTFAFSSYIGGGNSASGWADLGGAGSAADASSWGSSSAGGYGGVTSVSSGMVTAPGEGDSDAIVDPWEPGSTYEDHGPGWYEASTGWSASASDEEEISAGTSFVSFTVTATCTGASAYATVLSQGLGGSASANGSCDAGASGGASFP